MPRYQVRRNQFQWNSNGVSFSRQVEDAKSHRRRGNWARSQVPGFLGVQGEALSFPGGHRISRTQLVGTVRAKGTYDVASLQAAAFSHSRHLSSFSQPGLSLSSPAFPSTATFKPSSWVQLPWPLWNMTLPREYAKQMLLQ